MRRAPPTRVTLFDTSDEIGRRQVTSRKGKRRMELDEREDASGGAQRSNEDI